MSRSEAAERAMKEANLRAGVAETRAEELAVQLDHSQVRA